MKNTIKMILPKTESWEYFQKKTNLRKIAKMSGSLPTLMSKIYYKEYPRFKKIMLPTPESIHTSFIDTLLTRQTRRTFSQNKLTLAQLSSLLFFSSGVNPRYLNTKSQNRFYPSAGARFPLEIYLISQSHKNLGSGLYHYNIRTHSLEILPYKKSSSLNYIGEANYRLSNASIYIMITSIFNRTTLKYGVRGYRYIYMEAGHLMQNIYLVSAALNVNCCAIGGFIDKQINNILDLETQKEQTVYMCAIG